LENVMMFTQNEFAYAVATEGPDAYEVELTRMAHAAYERGVPASVVETMLDRSLPEILRQRAFGVAMRTMAHRPRPVAEPQGGAPRAA